ncbi:MAG: hypothetical protein V7647_3493 [Acidobacteriota bacterium]
MSVLYPVFLVGALAAAIPIVLHFLRREFASDVRFSAVRLLKQSPLPTAQRRRLRDLLLLAARVSALALLAVAFARPYLVGAASRSDSLRIVAVDRSFSMDAPGRFALALDRARAAVDRSRAGERVAVLAFDDRAEVVAEPGTAAQARAALGRIQPGFGGTKYAALFEKASELAGGAEGRLIVITDLQRVGWDDRRPTLDPGLELECVDVGPPPLNLAVTALRADGDSVIASIRNTGSASRNGELRLEVDGRIAANARYAVAGQSVGDVSVPYHARGGALAVAIEDAQGLAADNRRFFVPATQDRDALVIPGVDPQSGFFVDRALAAASADRADPAARRARDGAALADADLSRYGAVVLLSTRRLDRRGREAVATFVRSGGGVLIAGSPDIEPAVLATMFGGRGLWSGVDESAAGAVLSVTDLRHPIFRPFGPVAANLSQLRFERVWRLHSEGWEVAARFTDGRPALVERAEGRGRIVVFASDLDRRWNDFPAQPSFVPFAVEAVRYVSRVPPQTNYLVSDAPRGVPARPGIYRLPDGSRAVAVNVDPVESDTARIPAETFVAAGTKTHSPNHRVAALLAREAEARDNYWWYGLLLMLGALVAESIVGRV